VFVHASKPTMGRSPREICDGKVQRHSLHQHVILLLLLSFRSEQLQYPLAGCQAVMNKAGTQCRHFVAKRRQSVAMEAVCGFPPRDVVGVCMPMSKLLPFLCQTPHTRRLNLTCPSEKRFTRSPGGNVLHNEVHNSSEPKMLKVAQICHGQLQPKRP
jgi:hypothetical protein